MAVLSVLPTTDKSSSPTCRRDCCANTSIANGVSRGLVDVLMGYADGLDTAAAIRQGLGESPEVFDSGFKDYLEGEFSGHAGCA